MSARYPLVMNAGTVEQLQAGDSVLVRNLTATRVVYAGASGELVDDADLTFDGTTLSAGGLSSAGVVTMPATTSATVGVFKQAAVSLLHTYSHATANGGNLFIGGAGNFTMSPAGGAATLASGNTAIGASALAANTTGYQNTAIGTTALANNTYGNRNFALGLSSLFSNTAGENNIAIGQTALALNDLGSYNVAVGTSALYNSVGSSCVALGFGAGAYETGSNKLFIDNTYRANEADGRIKSLIYGVFASTPAAQDLIVNGQLGLNITPSAWLTLPAGAAGAGLAPLQLTSGTSLTTAVAGGVEFTTDDLYFTITTGAARKGVVLNDGTNLTSGKIPIASTNGRLIDGQTPLVGTKVYYVSDTSGGAVTRKLTFTDGILTAEV